MYKSILVTLDRSSLAEQALPHAVALAKAFGSTIELVTVVPITGFDTPQGGVHLDWEREVDEDREYIAGIVARVTDDNVPVKSEIRRGDIAEEILRHAQELHVDLIVMSTHGRSGLGRWVYGSIADRVLRYASVPVLLVRASEQ
ncbi:MAG: universal stress protein [Armatimonadota bacterium]